ncbi:MULTISPECIES: oligopeptide/dipeptide ABC transporter ATP-binding protein [unclassified Beijerinckia]|uniref:ABC transporter ATP-binding protein n=1 Tax=unclassified Beijerinckia TaxID=2638183 RepID=UPI000898113C|nr:MULTISPECIES: oligopeptide/dipeptide ABC transporter ATP-binding protein [unclassified Beijerinckia]MDH7798820.1 oligopeptide/dipeptide ABC transporter ATP-binding protein [Beijerinckia sp. GAS462]SED89796.1 peptide/nickel transport system ATP-binding protein/oligopeptide transport system ATP-binding protein [Beijerinckia sp. 28-YEA-48]
MSEALLDVSELVMKFTLDQRTKDGSPVVVSAVDGVSFQIKPGETLGLVGESGSGKSTTASLVLRMQRPTSGAVRLDGIDISVFSDRQLRNVRRKMQAVFQNPYASLNPRMQITDLIAEPLNVFGLGTKAERARAAGELLHRVGLASDIGARYPHQISGGQRQRIALARALVLNPSLIVLDEPVSALDVSIQAQIVRLLADLQAERGLAYLFIAHDLAVVAGLAHRVAVMYLGQIVEIGDTERIYRAPAHPYTRALLDATLDPDPRIERSRTHQALQGDIPTPANPPSGCRFHTRCPIVQDICRRSTPVLAGGPDRAVRCHFPLVSVPANPLSSTVPTGKVS